MIKKPKIIKKFVHDQEIGAKRELLEEIFYDFNKNRTSIYKMNFIRGIFFGLGTFLGGTLIVALVVWGLSLFVHIPGIGDTFQKAQDSLEQTQKK